MYCCFVRDDNFRMPGKINEQVSSAVFYIQLAEIKFKVSFFKILLHKFGNSHQNLGKIYGLSPKSSVKKVS